MSLAIDTGVTAERRRPLATVQQLRRALREADEERFMLQATLRRLRSIWPLALTVPLAAGATLVVASHWAAGTMLTEAVDAASLIESTPIVVPPAVPPSVGPRLHPSAMRDRNPPSLVQGRGPRKIELQPGVSYQVPSRDRSGFRPPPRIYSASR